MSLLEATYIGRIRNDAKLHYRLGRPRPGGRQA